MRRDRDLKRLAEDLHKNLKNEDIDCKELISHAALGVLRDLIRALGETVCSHCRSACDPGQRLSREALGAVLDRALPSDAVEAIRRELRRGLNVALQATRFGRNREVFKQALVSLFLLDKGVFSAHPVIQQLFMETVETTGGQSRPNETPFESEVRESILAAYSRKMLLEFREMAGPELVGALEEHGAFPPEELVQELVARGEEALPLLTGLLSRQASEGGLESTYTWGKVIPPACAILGEIGHPDAVGALTSCLRVDLTDQASLAMARLGEVSLPSFEEILMNREESPETRVQAVIGLVSMVSLHPEVGERVGRILKSVLEVEEDDPEVYEWAICCLEKLGLSGEFPTHIQGLLDTGALDPTDLELDDPLFGSSPWSSSGDPGEDALGRYRYEDQSWAPDRDDDDEDTGWDLDAFQGPLEPVRVGEKVGRNDPCPCGSGRKFKRCCGK